MEVFFFFFWRRTRAFGTAGDGGPWTWFANDSGTHDMTETTLLRTRTHTNVQTHTLYGIRLMIATSMFQGCDRNGSFGRTLDPRVNGAQEKPGLLLGTAANDLDRLMDLFWDLQETDK